MKARQYLFIKIYPTFHCHERVVTAASKRKTESLRDEELGLLSLT